MSTDYIPRKDADFNIWFQNLVNYVGQKTSGAPPEWTHIPQERVAELRAAFNGWSAAYAATLRPHTAARTADKNDARQTAEKVIRPFRLQFLDFDPVNDADRVNMGIRLHDAVLTHHNAVHETVDLELGIRSIREILVRFWVQGSGGRAKPVGYNGAVVAWDVLDAPPKRLDDLSRRALATRTPFAIRFKETERGKTAYVALAWQNGKGITGEWSAILHTIIP